MIACLEKVKKNVFALLSPWIQKTKKI